MTLNILFLILYTEIKLVMTGITWKMQNIFDDPAYSAEGETTENKPYQQKRILMI